MLIYGRPPCNVRANRRACECVGKNVFRAEKAILCRCTFTFQGPSVVGDWELLGRRSEVFGIQKLAHCERASCFCLFFPRACSITNTEWMHE